MVGDVAGLITSADVHPYADAIKPARNNYDNPPIGQLHTPSAKDLVAVGHYKKVIFEKTAEHQRDAREITQAIRGSAHQTPSAGP
jgi:hypothetical protein